MSFFPSGLCSVYKTFILFVCLFVVIIFVYLVILFFHCLFAVRKEPIMYYLCISDLFIDCFVYLFIRFVPFILIYSCIYGSFCLFGWFYNMFSDCTWKVTIIILFNDWFCWLVLTASKQRLSLLMTMVFVVKMYRPVFFNIFIKCACIYSLYMY